VIKRGNDPFACVSGGADGDHFCGAFSGKVLILTQATVQAGLIAALKQKYGSVSTGAPQKWVKCPRQEFVPATSTFSRVRSVRVRVRSCRGRLPRRVRRHVPRRGQVEPSDLKAQTYRKTFERCAIPATKSGWVNGASLTGRQLWNTQSLGNGRACAQLIGGAGMASDIEYEVASHPVPRDSTTAPASRAGS
jgi:hypothetical protein